MLDVLSATHAMREVFGDRARIQRMLDFEAALARAEADVGVIPTTAADSIARCCGVDDFDFDAIARASRDAGNFAIPLVKQLTECVARNDKAASGFVHWGATSQDAIDTGLVLQIRDALDLVGTQLDALGNALARQARVHRRTVMAGRTWLQHAVPVTFGLKLATTLAAVDRHRSRLPALRERVLVLQFGGAAGTLASLGSKGIAVESALANRLQLRVPTLPWHTQRDGFCEVAAFLGLVTATTGKLARDMALLGQAEVGEAREPTGHGRGGSSTMPQKRNPIGASIALAASVRVPPLVSTMLTAAVQEHERGLGNWPAEWSTLPEIFLLTAGALDAMAGAVEGLDVDVARMRANLDLTQGQIFAESAQMALATAVGRDSAHEIVAAAAKRATAEHRHLRDVLADDVRVTAAVDRDSLAKLFDPESYLGAADAFIERALTQRR